MGLLVLAEHGHTPNRWHRAIVRIDRWLEFPVLCSFYELLVDSEADRLSYGDLSGMSIRGDHKLKCDGPSTQFFAQEPLEIDIRHMHVGRATVNTSGDTYSAHAGLVYPVLRS